MPQAASSRVVNAMPQKILMSENTILLNIMEQLGGINAKLEAGAERHEEFRASLEKLNSRTGRIENQIETKLEPVVKSVGAMQPKMESLMVFKGRVGAVIAAASLIGAAAISLLWEGIKYIVHYFLPLH